MTVAIPNPGEILCMVGDAATRIADLPPASIHMAACSPPYWGQRNYELGDAEIGRPGQPLEAYVADLLTIGAAMHDATTEDAVWWLNIGDVAIGSGGSGGDYSAGGRFEGRAKTRQGRRTIGGQRLPAGTLGLLPYRVAIALGGIGWMTRSVVVWDKGRVRPEDPKHVKRPLYRWEPVFMLTKTVRCRWRGVGPIPDLWTIKAGRARRVTTGNHDAPWPAELANTLVALASEPGDVVLDCFAGSGTTPLAAARAGRVGVGIDLDAAMVATTREHAPGAVLEA